MKARSDSHLAGTLALVVVVATLACTRLARAQGGGLSLDWEAPAGCPSRDVVLKRLRAIVGPSVDRAGRLRAQGRIERDDGRYRLTLKVLEGDAATERVIESTSCSDLAGAAAVALGLLVRDELAVKEAAGAEARAGQASPSSEDPRAATAAATQSDSKKSNGERAAEEGSSEPSPEPAPQANESTNFSYLLRLPLIGMDVGPLPQPSLTFGFAAGVGFETLELMLGARLSLAQDVWVNATPSYGAEIRRASVEFSACYAFHSNRFAVAPCLLTALEPISARGIGDEVTSQTSHTVVFAVGAAALGRFRLGEFMALVLSVGGQLETSHPHIVVDGLGEVTQLAPFVFTTSTGVEWRL